MSESSGSEREAPGPGGGRSRVSQFGWHGGWWVVGQSVLMLAVVFSGVGLGVAAVPAYVFALGWVLVAAGGVLGVAGVAHLGSGRTPFPRPMEGAELVTSGVYGLVRHPLYASVLLGSAGWAMIWGSWVCGGVTLALGLFLDAKARREEGWLRERFAEYGAYAKRVRRLVPWVY